MLIVTSFVTYHFLSDVEGDRPVVNWIANPTPTRKAQVATFYRWLEKNNYPPIKINFDAEGRASTQVKIIVQGVSGVGSDVFDCYPGQVRLYQSIGILNDLTEVAEKMGFEGTRTYPGIQEAMYVNGHQYIFPRNVASHFLWVNMEAFNRVAMPIPPDVWTIDEFEKIGKEFIEKSNQGKEHQTVFFTKDLTIGDRIVMVRSNGVDFFNETLTQTNLKCLAYAESYERIYRWINNLHIIPTLAESKELVTSTGNAVSNVHVHLFAKGNYGLMPGGRWGLMYFREVGFKNLSVSELPHGGFRNTTFGFGGLAVYEGTKEKEAAHYFVKFMASEDYNMGIVENADGLPPIPKYTKTEEFLHPPDHPNEWGLHGRILQIAEEIAILRSESPFILLDTTTRLEKMLLKSL